MLTKLNLFNNYFNSNTNNQLNQVNQKSIKHTEALQTSTNAQTNNNGLHISSRSQKLNAINSEFFKGGDLTYLDVDALKNRAYELGLISKSEYEHLTSSENAPLKSNKSNEEDVSTTSLANFIGDFLARLEKLEQDESETSDDDEVKSKTLIALKEALSTAKKVISDVESASQDENFKESLSNSLSILQETINADSFEKMPIDDKVGISKVYQTLKIVDNFSPQYITNKKINKYIELSIK